MLEEELDKGPSAHGFEDERWTLARVQTVISRRLRVKLSVATVWRLLKRHGWSFWQAPARRALERDEHAVELWKKEVWPRVKGSRRHPGPGSSLRLTPGGQRGSVCGCRPWRVRSASRCPAPGSSSLLDASTVRAAAARPDAQDEDQPVKAGSTSWYVP
ncbi:winged helix-turn-helix domain-containing protein [Streptomyces sp. NPDC086835]|uniref:winged helix-turn-helix domain-containing protein n=1 Tax=Streptomyces sp. NPDC086835 TaxID=3365761 RepID=UPI00380C3F0E